MGAPLATSSPAESLFAQPRSVGDPVRVASRLAPLLGTAEIELHSLLTSSRPFVWIHRRLPPSTAAAVKALREPGLGFLPEPLRLYPNRELAAHVVGFEGVDGGLEGIERALDDTLTGAPGKAVVGRDALGREVVTETVLQRPAPGHGVMLTIDRTIQYLAEREIDAAWRRTQAKAAMAVVLDPRNGDVLAMAVRPTFNPNAFLDVPSRDHWRNRVVTDPFEPGSTFKVIMAAAALEEGVVRPEDRIWAENGSITIAKTTIHDWKKYGWLTFSEVLQNSSNVGSIKVGLALGRDRYYRYMTAFGFGAPTGVGLAGESRGQLRDLPRWSALSLPTMSIGQEVSVTALQMVAAFGAIANGGTLMQPRLVRSVFDAEGKEIRRFEPTRGPPGDLRRDRAHAHPDDDPGGGRRHRPQRGDPRVRRGGQDRDRAEARPGHEALLAQPRRAVVRRLRAGRRAEAGDAGDARRAQEREVGQRGGRAHLLGDRRRRAALPRRAAQRRHADGDRVRPLRDHAASARCGWPAQEVAEPGSDARVMPELRGRTLRHALATLAPARRRRQGGRPRPRRGAGARARRRAAGRDRRAADPGERHRQMTCRGTTCR